MPNDPFSFQPPQYNAQQYNGMWHNQPSFPNWSQHPFPPTSWPNQTNQNNWPSFPFCPPFWKNNYPTQWSPSTSQNQAWKSNWEKPTNHPAGSIPLSQPTLPAPYTNPHTNLRPQLLAQPNPNPKNRPVHFVQIMEPPEVETELRECNDPQLSSSRIVETERNNDVHNEDLLSIEQAKQSEKEVQQQNQQQVKTYSPPFPERLIIPRPLVQSNFDLLGELKNLCIKIPLLQAIQDIPIYAKTIKELCIKKPKRRTTTNPTVQIVGTLSDLLSGMETPIKYEDPGNHIVTVQINGQSFPNNLVDLGVAINILTTITYQKLGITSLEPTTTLLELANRSVVKPEGILQDVMVSVDSWEYPIDFLVINPNN